MATAQEWREKQAKAVRDAQALIEHREKDGETFSPEDDKTFKALIAESNDFRKSAEEIESRERILAEARDAAFAEEPVKVGERSFNGGKNLARQMEPEERTQVERSALRKWLLGQAEKATPEFTDEERSVMLFTAQRYPDMHQVRAYGEQVTTATGQGGALVPTLLRAEVVRGMEAFGGMRRVARILTTDTGADLGVPRSDDTQNQAEIVGEASTRSGSTHVPFGLVTLEAAKYQTGPIKISIEMLQDGVIDIDAFVRDALSERFGRATEGHYATRSSTESSGPHGIVNDSTGAVAVAGSSALTPEDLISLIHAVDPAYRGAPGVAWQMHDTTTELIAKLRTGSSGNFIWQPGLQSGMPDRLLGYRLVINNSFQQFTAQAKPIFFGDWGQYWIRDVRPMTLQTLVEKYATEGMIAVIGFARTDGRSVFGSTVAARKPIRAIIDSSTV